MKWHDSITEKIEDGDKTIVVSRTMSVSVPEVPGSQTSDGLWIQLQHGDKTLFHFMMDLETAIKFKAALDKVLAYENTLQSP